MTKQSDVFLQWHGTDVCLDFHCYNCNTFGHFDGFGCWEIQCPNCKQVYELPDVLALKPINSLDSHTKTAFDCEQKLNEMNWKEAIPLGTCKYPSDKKEQND